KAKGTQGDQGCGRSVSGNRRAEQDGRQYHCRQEGRKPPRNVPRPRDREGRSGSPTNERRFLRNLFMRGPLKEPVTFLDHLERSKRLLRLVVIVQLPRQIR